MSISVFIGEAFDYQHEREGFDYLVERLESHFDSRVDVVVMGNVMINGAEIDLLIATEAALVVADLKNYGGRIEFSENGPWSADGREVFGGAQLNPFRQIRSNRFALFDWLKGQPSLVNSVGKQWQASALVLFHKPIEFDANTIPPNVSKWFHVSDILRAPELIEGLATESSYVCPETLDLLPKKLGLRPYSDGLPELRDIPKEPEPSSAEGAVTQDTEAPPTNKAINEFIASKDNKVLCLDAMAGTDPEAALKQIESECALSGRDIVWLAPNVAVTKSLAAKYDRHCQSIYTHIFDKSSKKQDDALTQYAIRRNEDPSGCLYVLQKGHLVSNSYLQFEDARFGTGHLFDDFLEFTGIPDNQCQLIVVRDPYQLPRGGLRDTLGLALLEDKKIPSSAIVINDGQANADAGEIIAIARSIANAIDTQCFTTMSVDENGGQVINASDAGSKKKIVEGAFSEQNHDSVVLTSTNAQAIEVNSWIRDNVLGFGSPYPERGDRVILYNQIRAESDNGQLHTINSGNIGTVQWVAEEKISKLQALKGRSSAIKLEFREVCVQFDEQPEVVSRFLLHEKFLTDASSELDSDALVALKVLAESEVKQLMQEDIQELNRRKELVESGNCTKSEFEDFSAFFNRKRESLLRANRLFNAGRMKYAYAVTCHKAQGFHWPRVIVDAATDAGRHNEMYFRWVYTALTRSEQNVTFLNFVPLSPFDSMVWKGSSVQIVPDIPVSRSIHYDQGRQPTEEELSFPVPDGLSPEDPKLVLLWLEVRDRLRPAEIEIKAVYQHQYQEQYELSDQSGSKATISITYNGKRDVTNLKLLRGEETLGERAIASICGKDDVDNPVAASILAVMRDRLEVAGLVVSGIKETSYLLALTIDGLDSQRALIDVHFDGQGMIKTVLAKKTTSERIVEAIGVGLRPCGETYD